MATAYFDEDASGDWETSFVYDPANRQLYMGWYMSHPELVEDLEDEGIEDTNNDWVYGQLSNEGEDEYGIRLYSDSYGGSELNESEQQELTAKINDWLQRNPRKDEYFSGRGTGILASVTPKIQWLSHDDFQSFNFPGWSDTTDSTAVGLKYVYDPTMNTAYIWPCDSMGAPHHLDKIEQLESQGLLKMTPSTETGYWFNRGGGANNEDIHHALMGALEEQGFKFNERGGIENPQHVMQRTASMPTVHIVETEDHTHGGGVPYAYDPESDDLLLGTTSVYHHELFDAADDQGLSPDTMNSARGRVFTDDPDSPVQYYEGEWNYLSDAHKEAIRNALSEREWPVETKKGWRGALYADALFKVVPVHVPEDLQVADSQAWSNKRIPILYYNNTFYVGDDPGGHHFQLAEAAEEEGYGNIWGGPMGFIITPGNQGTEYYAPFIGVYFFETGGKPTQAAMQFAADQLSPSGKVYQAGANAKLLAQKAKEPKQNPDQMQLFTWNLNPYMASQVKIVLIPLDDAEQDNVTNQGPPLVYDMETDAVYVGDQRGYHMDLFEALDDDGIALTSYYDGRYIISTNSVMWYRSPPDRQPIEEAIINTIGPMYKKDIARFASSWNVIIVPTQGMSADVDHPGRAIAIDPDTHTVWVSSQPGSHMEMYESGWDSEDPRYYIPEENAHKVWFTDASNREIYWAFGGSFIPLSDRQEIEQAIRAAFAQHTSAVTPKVEWMTEKDPVYVRWVYDPDRNTIWCADQNGENGEYYHYEMIDDILDNEEGTTYDREYDDMWAGFYQDGSVRVVYNPNSPPFKYDLDDLDEEQEMNAAMSENEIITLVGPAINASLHTSKTAMGGRYCHKYIVDKDGVVCWARKPADFMLGPAYTHHYGIIEEYEDQGHTFDDNTLRDQSGFVALEPMENPWVANESSAKNMKPYDWVQYTDPTPEITAQVKEKYPEANYIGPSRIFRNSGLTPPKIITYDDMDKSRYDLWQNARRPFIYHPETDSVYVGSRGHHHGALADHIEDQGIQLDWPYTTGYIVEDPQPEGESPWHQQGVHELDRVSDSVLDFLGEHYGLPVHRYNYRETVSASMPDVQIVATPPTSSGVWGTRDGVRPMIYDWTNNTCYVGTSDCFHADLYEELADKGIFPADSTEGRLIVDRSQIHPNLKDQIPERYVWFGYNKHPAAPVSDYIYNQVVMPRTAARSPRIVVVHILPDESVYDRPFIWDQATNTVYEADAHGYHDDIIEALFDLDPSVDLSYRYCGRISDAGRVYWYSTLGEPVPDEVTQAIQKHGYSEWAVKNEQRTGSAHLGAFPRAYVYDTVTKNLILAPSHQEALEQLEDKQGELDMSRIAYGEWVFGQWIADGLVATPKEVLDSLPRPEASMNGMSEVGEDSLKPSRTFQSHTSNPPDLAIRNKSIPIFPRVNMQDRGSLTSKDVVNEIVKQMKTANLSEPLTSTRIYVEHLGKQGGGTTTLPPLVVGKGGEPAPKIAEYFGNADILDSLPESSIVEVNTGDFSEDDPDYSAGRPIIWQDGKLYIGSMGSHHYQLTEVLYHEMGIDLNVHWDEDTKEGAYLPEEGKIVWYDGPPKIASAPENRVVSESAATIEKPEFYDSDDIGEDYEWWDDPNQGMPVLDYVGQGRVLIGPRGMHHSDFLEWLYNEEISEDWIYDEHPQMGELGSNEYGSYLDTFAGADPARWEALARQLGCAFFNGETLRKTASAITIVPIQVPHPELHENGDQPFMYERTTNSLYYLADENGKPIAGHHYELVEALEEQDITLDEDVRGEFLPQGKASQFAGPAEQAHVMIYEYNYQVSPELIAAVQQLFPGQPIVSYDGTGKGTGEWSWYGLLKLASLDPGYSYPYCYQIGGELYIGDSPTAVHFDLAEQLEDDGIDYQSWPRGSNWGYIHVFTDHKIEVSPYSDAFPHEFNSPPEYTINAIMAKIPHAHYIKINALPPWDKNADADGWKVQQVDTSGKTNYVWDSDRYPLIVEPNTKTVYMGGYNKHHLDVVEAMEDQGVDISGGAHAILSHSVKGGYAKYFNAPFPDMPSDAELTQLTRPYAKFAKIANSKLKQLNSGIENGSAYKALYNWMTDHGYWWYVDEEALPSHSEMTPDDVDPDDDNWSYLYGDTDDDQLGIFSKTANNIIELPHEYDGDWQDKPWWSGIYNSQTGDLMYGSPDWHHDQLEETLEDSGHDVGMNPYYIAWLHPDYESEGSWDYQNYYGKDQGATTGEADWIKDQNPWLKHKLAAADPFTYHVVHVPGEGPDWSAQGGKYWWSGMFDPEEQTLYVGSQTLHHQDLQEHWMDYNNKTWDDLKPLYVMWYPANVQDYEYGKDKTPLSVKANGTTLEQLDWLRAQNPYVNGLPKESSIEPLVEKVRNNLTPDLLKPGYGGDNPMQGHCYVAVEALYHLLGGKESGYKPYRYRMPDGVVHWWLVSPEGEVVDPTHDQFDSDPPYEKGKAGGFLTREPSKRAQELMSRISKTAILKPQNDFFSFIYTQGRLYMTGNEFHYELVESHPELEDLDPEIPQVWGQVNLMFNNGNFDEAGNILPDLRPDGAYITWRSDWYEEEKSYYDEDEDIVHGEDQVENATYNSPLKGEARQAIADALGLPIYDEGMWIEPRFERRASSEFSDALSEAVQWLKEAGGFTITPQFAQADGNAYFCAISGHEEVVPIEQVDESILAQYKEKVADILDSDPALMIGGWVSEGLAYFDLSKAFKSLTEAKNFGIQNNQQAIWDGINQQEIFLGPKTASLSDKMRQFQHIIYDPHFEAAAFVDYAEPLTARVATTVVPVEISGGHGMGWPFFYNVHTDTLYIGTDQGYHYQLYEEHPDLEEMTDEDYLFGEGGDGGEALGYVSGRALSSADFEAYTRYNLEDAKAIKAGLAKFFGDHISKIAAGWQVKEVPNAVAGDNFRAWYGYPVILDEKHQIAYIGPLGAHHSDVVEELWDYGFLQANHWPQANVYPPETHDGNVDWVVEHYGRIDSIPELDPLLTDYARAHWPKQAVAYRMVHLPLDAAQPMGTKWFRDGTTIYYWYTDSGVDGLGFDGLPSHQEAMEYLEDETGKHVEISGNNCGHVQKIFTPEQIKEDPNRFDLVWDLKKSSADQDEVLDASPLFESYGISKVYKFLYFQDEDRIVLWQTDDEESPHHYEVAEWLEDQGQNIHDFDTGIAWEDNGEWHFIFDGADKEAIRPRVFKLIGQARKQTNAAVLN